MVVKKMEVVKRCPICGGSGSFHGQRDDSGIIVKMDKCADCGTLYQNPRLTRDSLDEFYQNGTYHRAYSRGNSQDRVNRIITLLRLMEITPKRVLDVGCANGYLLRSMQIWFSSHVLGFDKYVDTPLIKEIVSSKEEVDGKFDLITCLHVLEHYYDPQAELEWMLTKLEKGGTLLIEVPIEDKITFPHLYMYTEKALRMMVERTGMECMYIDHGRSGIAQVFIGNGYSRYKVERVVETVELTHTGPLYGY